MSIGDLKYVSYNRGKYRGFAACSVIASDFVQEAMLNRNTVLEGYSGRYLSYTKEINLCNEDIVIDVSFDTTDISNTFELIILKDNPEIPDNEKERVHWFCSRLLITYCKKNRLMCNEIAERIRSNFMSLFTGSNKEYCKKVLSEVYKNDKNNALDNY